MKQSSKELDAKRGAPRELSRAELDTTRELHRFNARMFDLLVQHFGGHATLNHLRIGNFIGLCSQYHGRPTSNSEIARVLRMSRATVSHIVSDLLRRGWVKEYPNPDDGRRRLLVITPDHAKGDAFERAFRRDLNDLMTRHAAGKLVLVDPDKRSF